MSEFDFIEKRKENIPANTKAYVKKCLDIIDRMHELMEDENILQKDLATRLNKSEAEVSRWVTGIQNFTLKTLVNLELALGKEIIHVPCRKNKVKPLRIQERPNNNSGMSKVSYEKFQEVASQPSSTPDLKVA
ncbi:MAG TPA: helix-turn-helix transcriptional regulator [Chitinophagaceae bacterium]|nr:helix-turn-helix transcriptional regulator [Chitinophagaceae bacterium]